MNEKIRELAEQSGFFPVPDETEWDWDYRAENARYERFAELIVKQCVAEAKDDCAGWSERDQCLVMQVMDRIKQHFGVKELKYLYHITPGERVDSILSNGIIPGYKKGLNCRLPERKPYVWLTDNPNYILEKQAGETWVELNHPKVIRVECADLDVRYFSKHEWFYEGTITNGLGVEKW